MNIYEHEGKYYTDRIATPIDYTPVGEYHEADSSKYHYMEVEYTDFEWKILMRGGYLSKREPLEVVPEGELALYMLGVMDQELGLI